MISSKDRDLEEYREWAERDYSESLEYNPEKMLMIFRNEISEGVDGKGEVPNKDVAIALSSIEGNVEYRSRWPPILTGEFLRRDMYENVDEERISKASERVKEALNRRNILENDLKSIEELKPLAEFLDSERCFKYQGKLVTPNKNTLSNAFLNSVFDVMKREGDSIKLFEMAENHYRIPAENSREKFREKFAEIDNENLEGFEERNNKNIVREEWFRGGIGLGRRLEGKIEGMRADEIRGDPLESDGERCFLYGNHEFVNKVLEN